MSDLLPPNSSDLARAVSEAAAFGVSPSGVATLWNPATCPAAHLPWLAWALSIDEWDDSWQTHIKRRVITESIAVHRQKGTLASVKRALSAAGYPYAQVDEKRHGHKRDGSIRRDGWPLHGGRQPFVYRVRLNGLVSLKQAEQIKRILNDTAPVRCHLHSLDFRGAPLLHNKFAVRDGSYTRGVVNV